MPFVLDSHRCRTLLKCRDLFNHKRIATEVGLKGTQKYYLCRKDKESKVIDLKVLLQKTDIKSQKAFLNMSISPFYETMFNMHHFAFLTLSH